MDPESFFFHWLPVKSSYVFRLITFFLQATNALQNVILENFILIFHILLTISNFATTCQLAAIRVVDWLRNIC